MSTARFALPFFAILGVCFVMPLLMLHYLEIEAEFRLILEVIIPLIGLGSIIFLIGHHYFKVLQKTSKY